MHSLPADQQLLYQDLVRKVDVQQDETGLVHVMGEVLRTLLRRKGDADFLITIQDAFTDGLADRPFAEQKQLAREVVRVVIEKRPEIALAWQALHRMQHPPPERRRATDVDGEDGLPVIEEAPLPEPVPLPAADLRLMEEEPPPPRPPYEFDDAELIVADYINGVLDRRLQIFQVPSLKMPSAAYCHEQAFFLFVPVFADVLAGFVNDILLVLCRDALERHVYRHIQPGAAHDPDKLKAFLSDKRPEMWKIVVERLTKLAGAHKNAEAKLAAAAAEGDDKGPEFKVVEIPHSRPKVHNILGVRFRLGTETAVRKVKVRLKPSTELDKEETEALELIAHFRDFAAGLGLELPASCDFQFLRTLFEFDAKRYAQAMKEFSALAGHKETTRQYLFDRLKFVDETYNNYLSDILVVRLFYEHGDSTFRFKELYDVCVGTALNHSALASKRPFIQVEVGRRPRELAFQVREVLRRRYDQDTLLGATQLLLDCCHVMARNRFKHELEAAQTVLSAFPVVFAGDGEERALTNIGREIHHTLSSKHPEPQACLQRVAELYGPVIARIKLMK